MTAGHAASYISAEPTSRHERVAVAWHWRAFSVPDPRPHPLAGTVFLRPAKALPCRLGTRPLHVAESIGKVQVASVDSGGAAVWVVVADFLAEHAQGQTRT